MKQLEIEQQVKYVIGGLRMLFFFFFDREDVVVKNENLMSN